MPNQFTKYTGTVTGQVGSLITALDAALVTGQGWGKIAGTNVASYRAPAGTRLYLYVDDTGATGSSGLTPVMESRVTGYETVASVGPIVGTNPFPAYLQNAGGNWLTSVAVRKSASANSTTRSYIIYADARTVYMFIQSGDVAGTYLGWMFGEFYSLVLGDQWNSMLMARNGDGNASETYEQTHRIITTLGAMTGHFVARSYLGLPGVNGSTNVGKHGDLAKAAGTYVLGSGGLAYPNAADAGLYLSPVWVHEPSPLAIRGRLRGFWQVCHGLGGFNDGDTFGGVGDLAGKSFIIVKPSAGSGLYCIETSATLETN